jgi:hypothetical protein
MSEPLPIRTPKPIDVRHVPPPLDRKTLQRIRDAIKALPCQNLRA